MPAINFTSLKPLQIPLPPLPTQKLIVQKLDSLFENIDKNINLTKENLKNLDELNKSVLEKVFSE
jgi:type I restriction enzyme S subunit